MSCACAWHVCPIMCTMWCMTEWYVRQLAALASGDVVGCGEVLQMVLRPLCPLLSSLYFLSSAILLFT
eukprot:scaffold13435_cov33-Tisochrysis_lutea.AAC.5